MIKKKIAIGILAVSFISVQSQANIGGALSGIFNDIFGEVFTKLDDSSMNVVGLCYTPNKFDLGLDGDICSVLGRIESELSGNVCRFAPEIPGFQKGGKNAGLTGLQSLCKTKAKNLQSITTGAAISKTKNIIDEATGGQEPKLDNGMTVKDYARRWSVTEVLKKGDKESNPMYKYLLGNKQEDLAMLKEFFATEDGGKEFNGGLANVNPKFVSKIKVPASLDEYEQGVKEMARITRDNYKSTSAYSVSAGFSGYIKDGGGKKNMQEAQKKGARYLATKEKEIETAQAIEIGQALALGRKQGDYAIPTQEMVDLLREDLKPAAIAKIRDQQRREAYITSTIAEKWEKRKALAALMIDKEVILSMEFDRKKAQAEIDKIANSAGGVNIGGNIGGNFGGIGIGGIIK